jgi:predicted nucleotidyltransferase
VTAEQAAAAIGRFTAACEADSLVAAAFLGGSYAADTATDESDIDVYLVTEERDYPAFFSRRVEFMNAWADIATLEDIPNFEGLGFDMLGFECRDGVWGQLALGHTGNMMRLHGGPHVVLVDKRGLLVGVTFPLL